MFVCIQRSVRRYQGCGSGGASAGAAGATATRPRASAIPAAAAADCPRNARRVSARVASPAMAGTIFGAREKSRDHVSHRRSKGNGQGFARRGKVSIVSFPFLTLFAIGGRSGGPLQETSLPRRRSFGRL